MASLESLLVPALGGHWGAAAKQIIIVFTYYYPRNSRSEADHSRTTTPSHDWDGGFQRGPAWPQEACRTQSSKEEKAKLWILSDCTATQCSRTEPLSRCPLQHRLLFCHDPTGRGGMISQVSVLSFTVCLFFWGLFTFSSLPFCYAGRKPSTFFCV